MFITWPWTLCSVLMKIRLFSAGNVQLWPPLPSPLTIPSLLFQSTEKMENPLCAQEITMLFFGGGVVFFPSSVVWYGFVVFRFSFTWMVESRTGLKDALLLLVKTVKSTAFLNPGTAALKLSSPSQLWFFCWRPLNRLNLAYKMNLVAPFSPHHQLKYLCY